MKFLICITSALAISFVSIGQSKEVSIPGSRIRVMTSRFVEKQKYELHILLPANYSKEKTYPVVYVLDSQWDFPLMKSIYGQLYYDGFVPELIIVGITWGGHKPDFDSLRGRDFTPSHSDYLTKSGGASKFLNFLKLELFPFIEVEYNASREERTLVGSSFGGLFALYTLFTEPKLFQGYVAASPAVEWDNKLVFHLEQQFLKMYSDVKVRLSICVGDVEESAPFYKEFVSQLESRNYRDLKIESRVLNNTGHSTSKSEGFSRGLQWVFKRNELTLSPDVLAKYVGMYQLPNGDKINIIRSAGSLSMNINGGTSRPLFANSVIDFYAKSLFLKLHVNMKNGVVDSVTIETLNNVSTARKIN